MKKILLLAMISSSFIYSFADNSNSALDYLRGQQANPHINQPAPIQMPNSVPIPMPVTDHNDHVSDYPSDSNHNFTSSQADVMIKQNAESLFKECILKSGQMIEVLDILKTIPEQERIKTLIESGYWESLTPAEQDKTMKILANFNGVSEDQHDIIKGQIADSLKDECFALVKNIKKD